MNIILLVANWQLSSILDHLYVSIVSKGTKAWLVIGYWHTIGTSTFKNRSNWKDLLLVFCCYGKFFLVLSSVAAHEHKQKYRYKSINYYLDFNNLIMCFRFWPCTEIILHNLTNSTNRHFECHAAFEQWDQLRVSLTDSVSTYYDQKHFISWNYTAVRGGSQ